MVNVGPVGMAVCNWLVSVPVRVSMGRRSPGMNMIVMALIVTMCMIMIQRIMRMQMSVLISEKHCQ